MHVFIATSTRTTGKYFSNWKKQPGCKDDRLLENVCLEKYIVDELHLLLRVTDRLEEGLFHTIIDQDEVWLSFHNKVFEELYDTINKPKLTEVEIDTFQQKVNNL